MAVVAPAIPRRPSPEPREVPTAADLIKQGLATAVDWRQDGTLSIVRIKPEGHALLREILRHNGRLRPMTTTVLCPVCQARPGQPCTRPTHTARKPVTYLHSARREEN